MRWAWESGDRLEPENLAGQEVRAREAGMAAEVGTTMCSSPLSMSARPRLVAGTASVCCRGEQRWGTAV